MEEWKECKLGDFIKIKHGYAFEGKSISFDDNNIVLVTPGNFAIGGGFQEKKCKFFHSAYPSEYILNENDLIVTMTDLSKDGDTLGYSAKVPYSDTRIYLHNQRIGLVQFINSEVDKDFIYWFMRSPLYQKTVLSTSSGSTVKHTSPDRICGISIKLPPLPTQQKIAAILLFLDDKIELNNKINTNLEQQAQALFKNWFVDDASELIENEIGKMDILITDYVANGSFKDLADNVKYLSNETDNVLIRLTDYNNNFSSDMVYISDESYNFLEKSKLFGDEIIISNVGANVGTVFRCPRLNKKMSLAPNSIMIRGGIYEHYLYLYFTSTYGQGLLKSIVTGSAQPKFNKTNFRSLKIKIPREEKLKKFNSVYDSLYVKIINNQNENMYLASLRNTLLPKLMNGEIEV